MCVLSANFSRLFVFAGYEWNKDYIAAELCENREQPQLECNGKCFLSKKLEQAKEKQKQQEKEIQKNGFQEAFVAFNSGFDFTVPEIHVQNAIVPHFHIVLKATAIFHPPKV